MQFDFSKIKKILIPILIIWIFLNMAFGFGDDTKDFPNAIHGKPVRFENASLMPNTGIQQVVADSERVYILYSSEVGVLQVYDLTGNYLHSLRLYKHMNGAFSMAVYDDKLYVRDYHADCYVFQDGEFVAFLRDEAADAILDIVPYEQFEKNSEGYTIKKGSVWHTAEQGAQCIVSRPAKSGIYQNHLNILLEFGVIAVFSIAAYVYKTKKKA